MNKNINLSTHVNWINGILFTFIIAFIGYLIALLPGFNKIGQLACAIIIAVIYRHFFGYPKKLKSGITFSSQKLLRTAIILYGLKLNIDTIFKDGLELLVRDSFVIAFAILFSIWLSKIIKADRMLSLLLGVGTGICGAAAIAAIAPIVKSKDEDTAISVGIIALVGTVFSIGYTLIYPLLPISATNFGIWSGTSLHELAHVAIAGAPAGNNALAIALLAKLGRVFLLVPVAFIFIYFMKRRNNSDKESNTKIAFPWFLIGFILMSIFGSYILGNIIILPNSVMGFISGLTTWLLTASMVGLGLNVNLQELKQRAFKPLLIMLVTSILVAIISFITL
ncbi:putative sulfate exporter family transporter [Staphylococcus nepalensis]|uniref:YeiH family protein n=1 Tax=Staphylococcus nepalensis TaxID=214473 RepID=UPI001A99A12E|nr:putative sulfate exporter family transporter [Staphylococcus nepalensis]MBO1217499.1 putative sulfate exporter family transporter [Staphylococcus nepalensis]MBO1237243.1 putative sulfate exporter family transporter [Staphylococcus nepalensis]